MKIQTQPQRSLTFNKLPQRAAETTPQDSVKIERATPMQKLVAYAGVVATGATVAGLIHGGAFSTLGSGLAVAGAMVGSYILADISTGLVHHFLDNVRPDALPRWMQHHAHDFQNHHDHPRDVVHREYANHTAGTQVFTTPMLAALAATSWTLPQLAPLTAGLTVFANCANLAQEFHRRAHMTDAENGPVIKAAQKLGLMVPKKLHAAHHGTGHNSKYALLNGVTNKVLDEFEFRLTPSGPKTNLLRKMEVGLSKWQGSDPNTWSETPGLKQKALGLS